ncbi:MAG: F0F1 ATP synthase subunit A [Firmicutes bacterium]|nr:F0F1 ATP synthase subunit A [Bacillota bacterium]
MNKKRRFLAVDILLIVMMIAPILFGIVLKVLTQPATEGIAVTGALVYFTIPLPLGGLPITESQVNSLLVILSVLALCLYLTHGIKEKAETRRQHVAEWIVEKVEGLVNENMGRYFSGFAPFIAAILALSAFSSLLSLFGLYPPTSDLNIVAGWAILVFVLITYYKNKCGPIIYAKSFAQPVPLLLPINIISEVATPISMAFRHYGNVLSGTVISVLVAAGLQGLSSLLLSWLPGFLGEIPFLQVGIPAVLSVYFDVFSGCLQAFIFAMLTMMYVAGGFPAEEYEKRKLKKQKTVKVN